MTFKMPPQQILLQCHLRVNVWMHLIASAMALPARVLIDSHPVELSRICRGAFFFPNDIHSPVTLLTFRSSYLFCTLCLHFEGHSEITSNHANRDLRSPP